jgi:hypothetical protein
VIFINKILWGANKEQILSIIRYSLTTIGTILVTTGTLNSLMVFQIGGGIMALISGIWSILDKTDSNMAIKMAEYQAKLEAEKVN